MLTEDEYQPIRALNDLLFCPRRCALHRIEGIWTENVHTLEGTHAHKKVHASPSDEEIFGSERIVRGLWVRSDRLRLVGVCDVVEFRQCASKTDASRTDASRTDWQSVLPARTDCQSVLQPFPIEYKRGRRRKWDNDEVQLCAQALCLEEMLGVPVPAGAIFNVKSKRRREIAFDAALRQRTEEAVAQLHELLDSGRTPPPVVHPKCQGCSVRSQCLPDLVAAGAAYQRAARALFVLGE